MLNIKIPCIFHKVRVAIKTDYLVHLSYKNSKGKERVSVNFKEKLEHTRKYAEAFWRHEMIDRPYVCVTAPKKPHKYSWSGAKSFRACMEEKYDDILLPFAEHMEATYYGGEALPQLELTLGPDQYALFLGADAKISAENNTTWVDPIISDIENFHAEIDYSEGSYLRKLIKFYKYASAAAKDKFMINMPDLHSNIDAISALRGAQDLCFDIMDTPEEVHRFLDEVNDTYEKIFNMAYEAGNMKDIGTIGWSPIYCRGKSAVLQCDFSCLLSPEQGKEYVFPSIEREASVQDGRIYHLDGKDALCHLDTILSMDCIDCIQWVPGAGQPRSIEWMDLLTKIQSAGKSLWIFDWTAEEIKANFKRLNPALVAFSVGTKTPDEADELLEYLVKNV